MLIIFRHPLFAFAHGPFQRRYPQAAERLDHAEKTRKQIRQISLEHPGITIADAYAIQKAWVEMKVAAGPRRQRPQDRADFEGDAERAQYRRAGFRHPARRHVLCRRRPRAHGPFHRPRVEAELAFLMKTQLAGPNCRCSTCSTPPTCGARAGDPRRPSGTVRPRTKSTQKVFDTIADNAANAGIVLGGRPIRPMDADLRCIGALCSPQRPARRNRTFRRRAQSPGDPSVAWLANKIAPNGLALEAGQVVLAEILHPPDRNPQR